MFPEVKDTDYRVQYINIVHTFKRDNGEGYTDAMASDVSLDASGN